MGDASPPSPLWRSPWIHRFRELTVTRTAYEACLGRQGSRAAFSQIQTAPGTAWCDAFGERHFAFEGRHGVSGERQRFFRGRHFSLKSPTAFGGRRVVRRRRQSTFSGRHAAFEGRHHSCLQNVAFNLLMVTLCFRRAAFCILRAARRLRRAATLSEGGIIPSGGGVLSAEGDRIPSV